LPLPQTFARQEYSTGPFKIEITIATRPSYPFFYTDFPPAPLNQYAPGQQVNSSFCYLHDLSETKFKGGWVTDIVCWGEETNQRNEENEPIYISMVDNAAVLVALQIHPQLVNYVIDEGYFVDTRDGSYNIFGNVLGSFSVVEKVEIQPHEIRSRLFPHGTCLAYDDRLFNSPASFWMLRAWSREDRIDKFVSFFIPLEIVLQGTKSGAEPGNSIDKIFELLRTYGGNDARDLSEHLTRVTKNQMPPSLGSRFETLARKATFPCCEADIESFRRLNRIRNNLVHRGGGYEQAKAALRQEDIAELEALVVRYLRWSLLQDSEKADHTTRDA